MVYYFAASAPEKKIVGIAPGSVWPTKRYPVEYFVKVAEDLYNKGYAIALFGGKDDKDSLDEFANLFKYPNFDFAYKTSLKELPAILSAVDLLLSNDSGAMHIAIAGGTPAVAVFGPTVKSLGFFPYDDKSIVVENNDINCRPCGKHGGHTCPKGHFKCMKDIEPERETSHYEDEIKEHIKEVTAPATKTEENIIEHKEYAVKQEEPLIKQAYSAEKSDIKSADDEEIEIREMETAKKAFFTSYNIPLSILKDPVNNVRLDSAEEMKAQGDILTQKLLDFGISGVVRAIQPGPVVTMFEFEPVAGTRVSKIASLESDLALSMSALSIRIIAPIPGKNAVGIEIPNKNRQSVSIKELLQTSEFKNSKSPLTVALGKDVIGKPYMSDIRKMPHLLVAGTTGSGKSVGINTMICSILYKSSPDEVKFIMIDPKMVELSIYDGIPHLMAPVVTDTRLAASVLKNVVAEMTRRYTLLAEKKVRNLDGYNEIIKDDEDAEKMPYLVVIVDEFADLMMVAGKDVEMSIARIAQMARAVGIHLIIATQRPTTNVITGLIKANMPARLSFKVSQKNDSRVIIDQNGADTLLGMGDSLFIPPGTSDALRIHGAFVSDDEVRGIVEYLHEQYGEPEYNMAMVQEVREGNSAGSDDEDEDVLYQQAVDAVMDKGTASISMIQRMFKIGYNRAARIVEMMEARGILEPSDGTAKPRKVIKR